MTALEHSAVNRAGEGDQSCPEPRTDARGTGVRAALVEVLRDAVPPRMTEGYYARVADRILGLVQPAEGVALTAEEAVTVAVWARNAGTTIRAFGSVVAMGGVTSEWCDTLAARLEGASA